MALDQPARRLNPLKHVLTTEFLIGELLFNGLTRLGYNMLPEPDLAVSWSSNPELTEWTFQLRPSVKFHDGSLLQPADVVGSINAILDPATGSSARLSIGPIASVAAVGPDKVRFSLSTPYADLPTALTHPNAKIVRASHVADSTVLDRNPVGTGPFTLTTFDPARVIDVKRNPDYFREGQPYVDRIRVLIYPDPTAETSALLSGGVDLIAKVHSTDYASLSNSPGIIGSRSRSGQILKIAMRCDLPPFNDVRVRQALGACIDREMMLAVLADGYGIIASDMPVSPAYRFYSDMPPKTRDLQKARKLLVDAGYPDGIDVELVTDTVPTMKLDFAVALREMAKPAGFRINIRLTPEATYLDQVWLKEKFYVGNYEMQPTIEAISSLLFSTHAPWNDSHWHDAFFDGLIQEARSELDPAKRAQLYAKAQGYMVDQTPSIIPIFFDVLAAHRDTVHGFKVHPRGAIFRLDGVWLS